MAKSNNEKINLESSIKKESSKRLYDDLKKFDERRLNIKEANLKQILKDLARTYPNVKMFTHKETQEKLKNVLRAFSNYDHNTCYYQGMNFIVGFFLYHCEEYVAFWLFVSLFDDYDLRDLFSENFSGLTKHSTYLKKLLKEKYPSIDEVFNKLKVNLEILLVEWLYSMFSSVIPLEIQINYYYGFFSLGWKFFYNMCISCFLNLEGTFNSPEDVYVALKYGKGNEMDEKEQTKMWEKIINRASELCEEEEN